MSPSAPLITAQATGKVIVCGEHAAVYGYPAVVASIDMACQVILKPQSTAQLSATFEHEDFFKKCFAIFAQYTGQPVFSGSVDVRGELPIGSGLGSSAAVAAASFKALAKFFGITLTAEELLTLVHQSEQYAHGQPSGIDATCVVMGGVLMVQKTPSGLTYERIHTAAFKKQPAFLIDSGKPRETTKQMVQWVAEQLAQKPAVSDILKEIGALALQFHEQLAGNTLDLRLIQENHRLLTQLGVTSPTALSMVTQVEAAGGVAKILGGGGMSAGSGMLLAFHTQPKQLRTLCDDLDWTYSETELGVST